MCMGGYVKTWGQPNQTSRLLHPPYTYTRTGTFEETPLVFVIDHIEAFAAAGTGGIGQGAHRKQLLLYSLMDLQHRSDLRFVVLGLSSECVRMFARVYLYCCGWGEKGRKSTA